MNGNDIVVSVHMISYNHESFIREAIEGVLKQITNFKFELVISDDCSTDRTRDIIYEYSKTYPEIVKPIVRDKNLGSMINFIDTFNYCRGQYIAICEGDDYWTDPFKLQLQVDFLNENSDYGLVYSKYLIKDEILNTVKTHELLIHCKNFTDFENYLYTADIRTLTVVFRSLFLPDIRQLFNQDEVLNGPIGDRPLFLLVASKSKIKYFDCNFGVYRIHSNESASRFHDKIVYKKFSLRCCELSIFLCNYLGINNPRYFNWLNRVILNKKIELKFFQRQYWHAINLLIMKTVRFYWRTDDIENAFRFIRGRIKGEM